MSAQVQRTKAALLLLIIVSQMCPEDFHTLSEEKI